MEDEEGGYMALHFKPRKEQQSEKSTSQVQETLQRRHRQHRLIDGAACAAIVLLIGAVIALGVWAWKMKEAVDTPEKTWVSPEPTKGAEHKPCLENLSHLREFLCKPLNNSTPESSSACRLCPQNWSLHDDKCYWVSRERQTWHKSKEDCRAKLSQLLVIQSQEEVAFIQSITEGAQLLWLGLEATFPERKWTWVDGSPLDDKLFQELGPVKANFCGRLNGNQISAEVCNTITMWICETEAFLL